VRAVLFDLDGTLLDIDIDAFLRRYFGALGPVLAELVDTTAARAIQAVMDATGAMMEPHPGSTNRDVFDARFLELTGVSLKDRDAEIRDFYARVFPTLGAGLGPTPGARRAVDVARSVGLEVVVATNPIFPAAAVAERIRWAGLGDVEFSLITTYENMHASKPDPAYFREIAALLDVPPADCLMVGDDFTLDMGAAHAGMATFYVGAGAQGVADYHGTLDDLADLLPSLSTC